MNKPPKKRPKLREPDRQQLRLVSLDLEAAIAADDGVRAVWAFVERIDLAPFYEQIQTAEGEPGRPAIDPRILLALWIQATLDGIGSARELERMCTQHLKYQWICGGVVPNYHTLSDFRSRSEEHLSRVLTETVSLLLNEGLVEMNRVAQDGVRVRASAGGGSFRRKRRLRELRTIAKEQLARLRTELEQDPGAASRREAAAREQAAKSRLKRVERALAQMPEAERRKKSKNGKKKVEARLSTTDPDARVMKMPDNGFRPAYNVQFASDTASKVIVAVDVTNEGTDLQQMEPMVDQVEQRYQRIPGQWLVDGGFILLEAIKRLAAKQCVVYGPPRKPRAPGRSATDVRAHDTEPIAAWRLRMASDEGKVIYKQRGATAELVNAHARNRGLYQFLVRGKDRVRSVALLHAVAHNFQRMVSLGVAF